MRLRSQQGAVALLSTIIISILISIITTGLIALMISELRQSDDAEQSVRAYYAAQSGVEDGISKVITALGSGTFTPQTCSGAPSTYQNLDLDPSQPGEVGWSCQQISYSGSPSGTLPVPDKAVQVDVGSGAFRSLTLQWDTTVAPSSGYGSFFNPPANSFPDVTASGWNYAAPLELAIVEYPSGSFSANTANVKLTNLLAVPHQGGGGSVAYTAIKGSNPVQGTCVTTGAYHCSLTITNLPAGQSFLFRLRSRYVGTSYLMQFMSGINGGGSVVNVPDGTATIDITAKAGDAFRRVIYKVPYQNGAATGLDYVIYSDTDICKNFSIINNALDPATTGCPY